MEKRLFFLESAIFHDLTCDVRGYLSGIPVLRLKIVSSCIMGLEYPRVQLPYGGVRGINSPVRKQQSVDGRSSLVHGIEPRKIRKLV